MNPVTDDPGVTSADPSVCTIVISFHPDLERLSRLCRQLEAQCQYIVVDNGSDPGVIAELEARLTQHGHIVSMGENRGIAAAQNAGVRYANTRLAQAPGYFLFLDQDSIPGEELVGSLRQEYEAIRQFDASVAAIGPALLDVRNHEFHRLHQETMGLYVKRAISPGQTGRRYRAASLNSSGTFVEASILAKIGGFREDLFIDHVDTEWSHRARYMGYSLYVTSDACLEHEMGRGLEKPWILGGQSFPSRAPLRHYYLFRNNVFLLSQPQMSRTWKFWSLLKMLFTFIYFGTASRDRKEQRSMMLQGISAGKKGNLGKFAPVD